MALYRASERPSLEAHVSRYADRRANAVAILSPDAVLAALLGAAVELHGYRAEFARDDESPVQTLRRVRPMYLLVDANDPRAVDETLLGRGLMSETRMFVFGTLERTEQLRDVMARYDAQSIVLPRDLDVLPAILTRRADPSQSRVRE